MDVEGRARMGGSGRSTARRLRSRQAVARIFNSGGGHGWAFRIVDPDRRIGCVRVHRACDHSWDAGLAQARHVRPPRRGDGHGNAARPERAAGRLSLPLLQ